MNILLDTHIALWAIADSPRLSARARDAIALADRVYVSAVSLWEIAIKRAIKRSAMPISAAVARRHFDSAGYSFLAIAPDHAIAVEALPQRHGDPFDRMLVAQALVEPLRLITHDRVLRSYSDTIILA